MKKIFKTPIIIATMIVGTTEVRADTLPGMQNHLAQCKPGQSPTQSRYVGKNMIVEDVCTDDKQIHPDIDTRNKSGDIFRYSYGVSF